MKISTGFINLLTILFIGLKLTGNITWSWFWVLSPLIFSVSIAVLLLLASLVLIASGAKVRKIK